MAEELKIRILNPQEVEDKLKSLGATFVGENKFSDTYFNQPVGEVFKITDTDNGFFLIQLKKNPEGKFDCLKNEKLEYADAVKAEMANEYGIKCVLEGKRKNYSLSDMTITISLIDHVGQFLIITSENPSPEFVTSHLGIQNPEYITNSFDELPSTDFRTPTE